jgi:hypothetical protein
MGRSGEGRAGQGRAGVCYRCAQGKCSDLSLGKSHDWKMPYARRSTADQVPCQTSEGRQRRDEGQVTNAGWLPLPHWAGVGWPAVGIM